MMELISLFEIELYKSDYALSCLTYSPGGYISNRIGSGLIWKALPDACLFLSEGDDQLALEGQPDCATYSSPAGQHACNLEELYPDDNCKKRGKEVENIILSGPQCTPGPEQVFRRQRLLMFPLSKLDQTKPAGQPERV